jgi:hypothetical protein
MRTRLIFRHLPLLALAAALTAGVAVAQDAEEPTTRPQRQLKVVMPYSLLEDLTEQQRADIVAVREDVAQRMRELRQEERTRILAVLSEEQRDRLPQLQRDHAKKLRDARRAEREKSTD